MTRRRRAIAQPLKARSQSAREIGFDWLCLSARSPLSAQKRRKLGLFCMIEGTRIVRDPCGFFRPLYRLPTVCIGRVMPRPLRLTMSYFVLGIRLDFMSTLVDHDTYVTPRRQAQSRRPANPSWLSFIALCAHPDTCHGELCEPSGPRARRFSRGETNLFDSGQILRLRLRMTIRG